MRGQASKTGGSLEIERVAPSIGALASGIDLSLPLSAGILRNLRTALFEYGVLFFRGQEITPDQHAAFARNFGDLAVPRTISDTTGNPMVAEVRKEPDALRNTGGNWHTDEAYEPTPDLGSVLVARELPPTGGDTMFASMTNAYRTLSPGLRKTLKTLRAVHAKSRALDPRNLPADRRLSTAEMAQVSNETLTRRAVHPVAPRHPESGSRILYVSPTYTSSFEGWTAEESAPLLGYLFEHGARPENTCRFRWEEGSVAVWDNRVVWHRALNDYHGFRRLMHRVSIKGVGWEEGV